VTLSDLFEHLRQLAVATPQDWDAVIEDCLTAAWPTYRSQVN
jgi:hypothetical protein